MAKLPNLKWIPMLLEAYNEARTRSGLKPVTPGELLTGVVKELPSHPMRAAKPASMLPSHTRTKPSPSRVLRTSPSRTRKSMGVTNNPGVQFHSVLRELRRTRKKLAQVEVLQSQLNHLKTTVERQLTELNQKLGSSSDSDHLNSPSRTAPEKVPHDQGLRGSQPKSATVEALPPSDVMNSEQLS